MGLPLSLHGRAQIRFAEFDKTGGRRLDPSNPRAEIGGSFRLHAGNVRRAIDLSSDDSASQPRTKTAPGGTCLCKLAQLPGGGC